MTGRRIVYVGNFTRSWCTEVHVAHALRANGHEVLEVQEDRCDFAKLPETVYGHRAEVLLWTRTVHVDRTIAVAALEELRAAGVASVSFHLDRFHGLDREAQIAEEPFFATDLLVTPDAGPWADYGVEALWMPPGVHGPECYGVPNLARWGHLEAAFVGSHPYPHKEWRPVRDALIATFERAFGDRFAVLPGRGRPALRGAELASLYATVPVLVGDSCLAGNPPRYWSDRIPETIGRGGYLIHPDVDGLAEWYTPGEHLDTYTAGAPDQALELARAALDVADEGGADRADRIRTAGRALVLSRDTYAHRMATLFEHLEARFTLAAPTPRSTTMAVQWSGGSARRPVTATLEVPYLPSTLEAVREVWTADAYALEPGKIAGRVVLDIGANVGSFTVLAAKAGAAWVVAYEPDPRNADVLERNVAANGIGARVAVHRVAVMGEPGLVSITGEGGGSTAHPAAEPGPGTVEAYGIAAVIDAAATLGPIALLKLDVEGAEYDITAGPGFVEALTAYVSEMVMEWHGPAMPHLAHLATGEPGELAFDLSLSDYVADGASHVHAIRWGLMVARLADAGAITTFGHPSRGGILRWKRYGQ